MKSGWDLAGGGSGREGNPVEGCGSVPSKLLFPCTVPELRVVVVAAPLLMKIKTTVVMGARISPVPGIMISTDRLIAPHTCPSRRAVIVLMLEMRPERLST